MELATRERATQMLKLEEHDELISHPLPLSCNWLQKFWTMHSIDNNEMQEKDTLTVFLQINPLLSRPFSKTLLQVYIHACMYNS